MKRVGFFNSKAGVGKTTLVYHLASMIAERGQRVLVVDLDPQADLTRLFLTDAAIETLWTAGKTIFGAVDHDSVPHVEEITPRLGLVVGDLRLAMLDRMFSSAWLRTQESAAAYAVLAFDRVIRQAAEAFRATWVLIDVGATLDGLSGAALAASDSVVVATVPDFFAVRSLSNVGHALRRWRAGLDDGESRMLPIGYVVMQHGMHENRLSSSSQWWLSLLPVTYRQWVLGETFDPGPSTDRDPNCLAVLTHYRSLIPMALDARKPVFLLKPADGAIGAHVEAVQSAYEDFLALARRIADVCGLEAP